MRNKQPENKPLVAEGTAGLVAPNPMEAKKETTPTFTTPARKPDFMPSCDGTAVIGKAVKIVGEIYSNQDLLIEGFVQGTVEVLNQKLTVGLNGTLQATVQVRELDVHGNVQGDIEATDRVDIRNGASLVGNIKAARIVIEDGAHFKGNIDIVKPEAAGKAAA